MRLSFPVLCALAALAAPARAQTPSVPPAAVEAGRYSMTPAESGFLRLDKETGSVAFCSVKDGLSVCRAGADERAALEAEISRLRLENLELKARASGAAPGKPSTLPNEEEFERALSFTERFMRRIMRLFREEAPPGDKS
jgi:hypothetical protein